MISTFTACASLPLRAPLKPAIRFVRAAATWKMVEMRIDRDALASATSSDQSVGVIGRRSSFSVNGMTASPALSLSLSLSPSVYVSFVDDLTTKHAAPD